MKNKSVFFRRIAASLSVILLIFVTGISNVDSTPLMDYDSRISAGDDYSMAILDDDSLWGWGSDNGVHLGRRYSGTPIVSKPAPIMKDAKAVHAGWGTTLVIKNDNSLWAWGDNMPGAGEDRLAYALKPEKIMDDVISASSGNWFVLAVKSDGSLWAWGNNIETRLNENLKVKDNKNKYFYTPVVKPTKIMDGVKKVKASGHSYFVLKNDGTLLSYGTGVSSNNKVSVNGICYYVLDTGVIDMSLPTGSAYYIKNDGSLWGIGQKVYEDLDMSKFDYNKKSAYDRTPVKVMENVKSAFHAGAFLPAALKKDGKLVVWSTTGSVDSFFTQNPIDINTWLKRKTLPLMDGVRAINGGTSQLLVSKNDGSVWIWGFGVLGDGNDNGSTLKSSKFIKLEFNKDEEPLFTSGTQKSRLLSDWIKEKEASGGIPLYNPGYKANWECDYWEENMVPGFHTAQSGSMVYGYDSWNSLIMVGKAEGNKLSGHIYDGIFEIRMNPDGKSYSGFIFDNSAAEAGYWTGIRKR